MSQVLSSNSQGRARRLVELLEGLAEQKRELAEEERSFRKELKELGVSPAALAEVLKLRRLSASEREDHEDAVDQLKHALGMLADTPLGEAALRPRRRADDDQVDLEELTRKAAAAGVTVEPDGALKIPAPAKPPRARKPSQAQVEADTQAFLAATDAAAKPKPRKPGRKPGPKPGAKRAGRTSPHPS